MHNQPIYTDRLMLRPFTMDDSNDIFMLDSNVKVMEYLGNIKVKNIEDSSTYLKIIMKQYSDNDIGRWAIIEKNSGKFVGWSGIKWITDNINGFKNIYDLGYRLMPEFWGQGYATESCLAWIEYTKKHLDIKMLYATAHVNNLASQKVLSKCGFLTKNTFNFHLNGQDLPCQWLELPI